MLDIFKLIGFIALHCVFYFSLKCIILRLNELPRSARCKKCEGSEVMDITIKPLKEINICSYCFGSGKLKAMQSVIISNGSVIGKNKEVKCKYCNGTGIRN